ncbi:MAG: sodium/solute symporter [Phycisphaerales bacterium]|nr:MAG: sodium/solute symporter [Phycisphaerales bacterium]
MDITILAAYFAAAAAIGVLFGRRQCSTEDYFLGRRRIPWVVVAASLFATELSALTVIGVPAKGFDSDFWYLQYFFGSALARVAIAFIFLPAFYGHRVTTVYEYLGLRFGPWTRAAGALLFFLSRVLGSGVRLLAASIALQMVTGWDLLTVIALTALLAVAYVCFGGIKAIVWTDAFQATVFIGGAVAMIVYLVGQIPGGWSAAWEAASSAGKLKLFHFGVSLNNDMSFVLGLANGFFVTFAALGTDQDLTQRLLTCKDVRASQRSILVTAVVGLPIVITFLLIGTLMFVYATCHAVDLPRVADDVYPYFLAHICPTGLRGVLIAGVFAAGMSSLDSALGALSSSAVFDFYRPYFRREASETHYLRVSRVLVLAFGAIIVGMAWAFSGSEDILRLAFRIASIVFGPMLGVFLLGTLTRRGRDKNNVAAMITAGLLLLLLDGYQRTTGTVYLAWPWYIVAGTGLTFLWGWLAWPRHGGHSSGFPVVDSAQ